MKRASFKSLLVVAVCVFSAGIVVTHAQAQRQDAPVVVTNTTANPVPVTGQVNVGTLPAVDAKQSGVWNVGITGTPTVKLDSTTNTVQVERGLNYQRTEAISWTGQGSEAFTTNFTDKFSQIRVCVAHTGPNPIQVNVFSLISDATHPSAFVTYDAFIIGSPNTVCKIYELPGASTQVLLSNTGNNTTGIARFALIGY
jgi:hypothetical protein